MPVKLKYYSHKIQTTLYFVLCTLYSLGQSLDPKLIASGGHFAQNGTMSLSYSIGEPATTTLSTSNNHLTQGFQQPKINSLELIVKVNDVTCVGANNGYAVVTPQSGTKPYTYTWLPYGGTADTSTFLVPGNYNVTVTDSTGKKITQSFTINETQADCGFKIYTGLTPNGDGANDCWYVENIEKFPGNFVKIYNRYGQEVWSGKDYDNTSIKWCATNQNGNDLIAGTYYYVIKLTVSTYTGWVEISR